MKNQCDGCRAGRIRVYGTESGTPYHRMSDGIYPDLMVCQAGRYSAAPEVKMGNQEIIEDAIKARTAVSIRYKGMDRDVLPVMLGITRDGRIVLQGFQLQGLQVGEKSGWRYFYLDEMAPQSVSFWAEPTPSAYWAQASGTIKKSEDGQYTPPAFVAKILAVVTL